MDAPSRWTGTQLGVGVLGRHRRCCIELATGGVLRLLAENAQQKDGHKTSWIRLSNRRTTVLYDCWVEDLSREAEVKPRKSKPDLNSVHLCLPQNSRQLPVAAVVRPKGGGRGGNGDKADCQPRWQGGEKPAEPLLIRVTLDGGRESEQEVCKLINEAARECGRRRAELKSRVAALLELRQTCFSPSNALHTQQLTDLWHLAMGDDAPSPPSCMPADGTARLDSSGAAGGPDWGDLGFQNRLCPQSDFRDMGMLSVHLLSYYARNYRQEVASLVQANGAREEGYPFAAAAINVGHMVLKMLVQGLSPEEEALLCAQFRDDTPCGPSIALCSPLFVVLSRVVEDDTGGQGQGDGGGDGDGVARGGGQALRVLEEMFCAAFRLLEQLWVRHEAKYMMFNRILAGVSKCIGLYVQDEWRQPTGSLKALRDFDVSRVQLPPDPMSSIDVSSSPSRPSSVTLSTGSNDRSPLQRPLSKSKRLSGPHAATPTASSSAQEAAAPDKFVIHGSAPLGDGGKEGVPASSQGGSETGGVAGADAVDTVMEGAAAHPKDAEASSPSGPCARRSPVARADSSGIRERRALSFDSSSGSLYGPGLMESVESYEGGYDDEGRFSRYLAGLDAETSGDAASLVQALQAECLDRGGCGEGSCGEGSTSGAETPPSEVDDDDADRVDHLVDILEWSPSGNMV